jgi:transcriptional regulator with XRE-family HTH domain
MFWDVFYDLCLKANKKPLQVVKEIGSAAGSITQWKNGGIPSGITLIKISKYFNVSIDYLLGLSHNSTITGEDLRIEKLSVDEIRLIRAYRENADMQSAVNKLLGIETENATGSIADDIEKIITDFTPARQSTDTK